MAALLGHLHAGFEEGILQPPARDAVASGGTALKHVLMTTSGAKEHHVVRERLEGQCHAGPRQPSEIELVGSRWRGRKIAEVASTLAA